MMNRAETSRRWSRFLIGVTALMLAVGVAPAGAAEPADADQREQAQREESRQRGEIRFDIPPATLGDVLTTFGMQSGLQVSFTPELVEGKRSAGLTGRFTTAAGLTKLLRGSGLEYAFLNGSTVAIQPYQSQSPAAKPERTPTGTIRGTVTLSDGAAAQGATVTAVSSAESAEKSAEKATRRTALTDREGRYVLDDLPPGRYTLTFELGGMATQEQIATAVAGEETTVDVTLDLEEFEEEIAVVGSRLGSKPTESAMPVKVLTREEIDRSGAGSVAQALSLLPEVSLLNNGDHRVTSAAGDQAGSTNSTTVQLRGLPVGTTLVLLNGRRVGSSAAFTSRLSNAFFDLTNIPLSMVERIEVLPFGASAVYGGDALAGVVNIVTKRNASGLDVRVRNSMADGFDETQASVTWGKSWSQGSLTATASYLKQGTLRTSERAITRSADFSRFGGRDFRNATFASPGTVYSLDGCESDPTFIAFGFCSVPLEERGNLPGLSAPLAGIPAGQDGTSLTPADFAATAGIENLGSSVRQLFSGSETTSLSLQGRWELGRRLELFGDLLYTRRDVPRFENFVGPSGGRSGLTRSIVPAENPFNPFGVDVAVTNVQQTTGVFNAYEPEYLQPTLGLRGGWGEWSWELAGSLSKDLTDSDSRVQNFAALETALANPDPATALNVFRGDGGSFGSPELLESLLAEPDPFDFNSDLWQANGFVRGPLARLPAGPVEALFGFEWERQELEIIQLPEDPESIANVTGSDESRAAFAELRLPLLARSAVSSGGSSAGPSGGVSQELLALTGAFRLDESDRLEETGTTGTVGLELRPASALLLRATTSSAFKPPSGFTAFGSPVEILFPVFPVTDPKMGGESVLVGLILGAGLPEGLEAETSRSTTVGVVWTPSSLSGLNLSVTAWESRLRDRISSVAEQFLVDNEDLFPGRVIRDPETGVITVVDIRQINIARTNTEGIDLGLSWRYSTRYGEFSPSLQATWVGKYEEQITPDSPVEDRLAVLTPSFFSGWSPRWKGTTSLNWGLRDQVSATLIGRYVSAYQDPIAFATGPKEGTFQTLGDFWLFDLNVELGLGRWLVSGASPLSDTRLSLGAVNLFNRLPDFCNACGDRGYDASQYDLRGRFAYAELRFGF